ncbi:MAG: hypothetical protein JRE40_11205 [Deltaproteobacteria bacterium]|nr:hypothetical protein [Deltaproteobacteria bacterium]
MKITDPAVIRSGESELIDAITADMDWGGIGKVFLEKHKLDIDDDVEYKNGDIVVYNNEIAYKLEFDVKVNLSILLNREGNYISLSTDLDSDAAEEGGDEERLAEPDQAESEEEGCAESAEPDETKGTEEDSLEETASEPDQGEPDEEENLDSTDDKDSQENDSEGADETETEVEDAAEAEDVVE